MAKRSKTLKFQALAKIRAKSSRTIAKHKSLNSEKHMLKIKLPKQMLKLGWVIKNWTVISG